MFSFYVSFLVPIEGIEPSLQGYESCVLPLNYIGKYSSFVNKYIQFKKTNEKIQTFFKKLYFLIFYIISTILSVPTSSSC